MAVSIVNSFARWKLIRGLDTCKLKNCLRLRSHRHEYESGTVWVPDSLLVYNFVCISMAAVYIGTSMPLFFLLLL